MWTLSYTAQIIHVPVTSECPGVIDPSRFVLCRACRCDGGLKYVSNLPGNLKEITIDTNLAEPGRTRVLRRKNRISTDRSLGRGTWNLHRTKLGIRWRGGTVVVHMTVTRGGNEGTNEVVIRNLLLRFRSLFVFFFLFSSPEI